MIMQLIVAVGWGAWVMALFLFLVQEYRAARARRSAIARRVDKLMDLPVDRFTADDVRMVLNGDYRDAIEIHADKMNRAYGLACFLALAGVLCVLGLF